MGREEFLEKLYGALDSSLAPAMVNEHVRYYAEYIDEQVRTGRQEREVLNSLGDPRLIARTITDAAFAEEEDRDYKAGKGNGYRKGQYQYVNEYGSEYAVSQSQRPIWVWVLAAVLIAVLILSAVMSVLSFLAPILVPLMLVLFLVKLFRDWLR